MTDVREAFLVGVETNDDIMGRSKNYKSPETTEENSNIVVSNESDSGYVLIPEGTEMEWKPVVVIHEEPNGNGIVLKTGNRFFRRLWLMISNPFRYLFTGKIYY